RADIDVQDGQYAKGRSAYEELIESHPTWDRIARTAYVESVLGNADRADAMYASAQDLLTASNMRDYAWLELQRGLLELRRGRFEPALAHYERADRASSGYWMTQDYLAELLAARAGTSESGHTFSKTDGLRDAAAILERLVRTHAATPQVEQSL